MSNINILLNYYLENSYLNLNNSIQIDQLNLLLESISKYNIVITNINVPKDFKFINLIKNKFKEQIIKEF
jgi:hypothetical protein